MKNYFYLKQQTQCSWCETMANIFVIDTEKQPSPICQKHYEFFTEPKWYWAWKNRNEKIKSNSVDNLQESDKNDSI